MTQPEPCVFTNEQIDRAIDIALTASIQKNTIAIDMAVAPLFIFGTTTDRYKFTAGMIHHVADTIPTTCPCGNPEHGTPTMVIGYAKLEENGEWNLARDEEGNEITPLELQVMAPEVVTIMEMLKADVMGNLDESARLYASATAAEIEPDVIAAAIRMVGDQLRPLLGGL